MPQAIHGNLLVAAEEDQAELVAQALAQAAAAALMPSMPIWLQCRASRLTSALLARPDQQRRAPVAREAIPMSGARHYRLPPAARQGALEELFILGATPAAGQQDQVPDLLLHPTREAMEANQVVREMRLAAAAALQVPVELEELVGAAVREPSVQLLEAAAAAPITGQLEASALYLRPAAQVETAALAEQAELVAAPAPQATLEVMAAAAAAADLAAALMVRWVAPAEQVRSSMPLTDAAVVAAVAALVIQRLAAPAETMAVLAVAAVAAVDQPQGALEPPVSSS